MCNLDGLWLSAGTMLSKRDDICAVLRIPRKNPPKHAAFLRRSSSLCPSHHAWPRSSYKGWAGGLSTRGRRRAAAIQSEASELFALETILEVKVFGTG